MNGSKNKDVAVRPMIKPNRRLTPSLVSGIFLVSLSVLLLEIAFTRVLSVVLSYHFVYLVISMALLGLGIGGILAYRFSVSIGRLSIVAGSLALVIPGVFLGIARLNLTNLILYGLLILVPFALAGIIVSRIFQEFASNSGKVYAADLCGAAAGALLAIPVLDSLGGMKAGFLIGLVAALAGLLFLRTDHKKVWFPAVSTLVAGIIFFLGLLFPAWSEISLQQNTLKEMAASLQEKDIGSKIVDTRWSSFGRTDIVRYEAEPNYMSIFLDATAGTAMYRFTGDLDNPGPAIDSLKSEFTGYFPLQYLGAEQKDNSLIIGAGGGRDVLANLVAGIKDITAVEINPDTVEMVKDYSKYNGGIYTSFPDVKVVVAEGRSYLRQQQKQYDLIMMSLPVTKTSRSPQGFALTESFLFTKESMVDYYNHLTKEGRLVIVNHGGPEVARLVSLALAVLEDDGITDQIAMNYIYTLGSHHEAVFVFSRSPLSSSEAYQGHRAVHGGNFEPGASYFPYIASQADADHVSQNIFDRCQMLDPLMTLVSMGHLRLSDFARLYGQMGINVSTVTDEKPFFYNFEPGLPGGLLATLLISLLALATVFFIPRLFFKQRSLAVSDNKKSGSSGKFAIFFIMLGAGFMLAEIPLIQKFTLFLGEPVLSVSILLFSILSGAGIGALLSNRLNRNGLRKKTGFIVAGIALALIINAFIAPIILRQLLGLSLVLRVVISELMLIPLGFLMGFPFPIGIRLLQQSNLDTYIPWMWGFNGTASVLGSVVAIILSMKVGFAAATVFGAVCYLVAWLSLPRTQQNPGHDVK